MKFVKGRKPLNEINVTPFVDVVLVLLVIFMLTAPLSHQGLKVQLPKTKASGLAIPEKPLILTIKRNGALYLSGLRFSMKQLPVKIKALTKARKDKSIYIQADRRVSYGLVTQVMAQVKSAGLYNIGLITTVK